MAAQFNLTKGRPHRELRLCIACAISSLPVPVSPWIKTVESVGATRSTCSSTDSRAGLLPIICSNLRSQSLQLSLWKAPTENLLAHAPSIGLIPQSRSNALEQDLIVKRFGEEFHRARSKRLHTHFCVAVRRDEDGWNSVMLSVQFGLQFQTGHSWHANIRDQACGLLLLAGLKEFLRRRKRL